MLTGKQRLFVDEYCSNGMNASKAYKTAYPDCKTGWRCHGAKNMTKHNIKQAISKYMAENKAKIEHNRDIAIAQLNQNIAWLTPKAKTGDTQAIQALTGAIRELDAISNLHSQRILTEASEAKPLTEQEVAELKKLAGKTTVIKLQDIA